MKEEESVAKEKVMSFAVKYGLKSKDGSLSVLDTITALAIKYKIDIKFDKDGDVVITKPEPDVTENFIRIRVLNPGDFVSYSFRTITISA